MPGSDPCAVPDPSAQGSAYDAWAEYYDVADADRRPFIEFYRGLLGPGTASLLELACGTGTIAIALAEAESQAGRALRVVGLDQSPAMLNVARARAPQHEWLQADMREPPLAGPFDLVICCFNSLQHMLDDDSLLRVFRAVHRLLAPAGRFAFDLYRPNLPHLRGLPPDRLARSFRDRDGQSLQIREDAHYNEASRILDVQWRLHGEPPSTSPRARMHMQLRQYFPEDLDRLLALAGLAVRARHGDFDRSPFTPDALRQVLVCERDAHARTNLKS